VKSGAEERGLSGESPSSLFVFAHKEKIRTRGRKSKANFFIFLSGLILILPFEHLCQ
jgi:hypothetical protein